MSDVNHMFMQVLKIKTFHIFMSGPMSTANDVRSSSNETGFLS